MSIEQVSPDATIAELLEQIKSLHLALAIWSATAKQLQQELQQTRQEFEILVQQRETSLPCEPEARVVPDVA